VTTLLFLMGFGAIHEIMEYMTYLVLGEAKGMLKPQTSYVFDTARDLTNNFLGTLTALLTMWLVRAVSASDADRNSDPSRGRAPLRAAQTASSPTASAGK
jgi:hypothetical protein